MNINRQVVEWIDKGRPFALALVLESDGSTPCKTGAKAIIDEAGKITGTIGGGHVEAQAQRYSIEACGSGRPLVFDVKLDSQDAAGEAPLCGGSMRVLIDPTAATDRASYLHAAEAIDKRGKGVLVTAIRHSGRLHVAARWCAEGQAEDLAGFPGAGAITSTLRSETARLFASAQEPGGMIEALVEPVVAPPRLLIVGGGHIGQALARQGALIGFDVTVLDDRQEFTDAALFPPGVRTISGQIAAGLGASSIDEQSYVVIVTRGHRQDAQALEACIDSPAAYLGMIGSRRKIAMMREEFIANATATPEQFDRVFAPIGLDIAAVTVEEIALSIAAEIIAVRRRGCEGPPPGHMAQR